VEKLWGELWRNYDLLFIRHLDAPLAAIQMFATRDYFGGKVIGDIDDNYDAVMPDNTAWEFYYEGSPKRDITHFWLKGCNAVTVTRRALWEVTLKYNPKVYICPNFFDDADWPHFHRKRKREARFSGVRVGYAGGSSHKKDLETCEDAVVEVLRKYPKAKFVAVGPQKEIFAGYPEGRLEVHRGTLNFEDYTDYLPRVGLDIGIAPLAKNEFNRAKSACKFYEYTAAGAVGVYQGNAWSPYRGVVEHGKTGFLATSRHEWVKFISYLIEHPRERAGMLEEAKKALMGKFHIRNNIHLWRRVLEDVLNG